LNPDANMHLKINRRRRWFGLLYLILSGGLLIWGLTWLGPVLRGVGFVLYWLACLALALAALGVAWLDWRSVRRQWRAGQHELLEHALDTISRPGSPCPPAAPPEPPDRSSR
jgi:Flp pilus assembly protein TadB